MLSTVFLFVFVMLREKLLGSLKGRRRAGYTIIGISVCGLQSSTSGKLKIHMRSHTKERPHNCVHCNLSFKQSSTLKLHEFKHKQSLAFQCDRCQKCFPIRSKLVMHMRRQRCHQSRHKLTRRPPPPAECAEVTEMKAKPEDGLFLVECFVDPIQTIGDHLIL